MDRTIERLAREDRQNELCRLQGKVARLNLALDDAKAEAAVNAGDLRDAKECLSIANDGLPMDMGLWAMMKRQRDHAVVALRDLYDCQNGPPLPGRHEKHWRKAYDHAGKMLKELEPTE